ncbi:MAG: transposase [Mycolicibacterium insubricum]
MKNIAVAPRVKVSADGHGVVSHAGMGMLREVADLTGLSAQVTAVLADTYKGPWVYAPGEVFADLAAAVADGADCIDGVGQLCGDREHVFGAKASTTTMWRLVDERIDAAHLPGIRGSKRRQGRGMGRRRRPRHRRVLASGLRRHRDHRPFRQQGTGIADLEKDLRHAPAAGVSGPPRDRRR